jgi:hypothetical protein
MARQCLFCPNPVNSNEHVFSNWILKDLKLVTALKITIGRKPSVFLAKPEVKVRSVCRPCNNGWMSGLENENKTAIRAMINDDPCWLTEKTQTSLCRWAVMKAMVIESANRQRALFYDSDERTEIKSSSIPTGTLAWLGRLSAKAFHAGGTDIWGDVETIPKGFHGSVTTIIMGHLVIQILNGHTPPQFGQTALRINPKDGAWNVNLVDIWPTTKDLHWPPAVSFSLGKQNSIGSLIDRRKIGTNLG